MSLRLFLVLRRSPAQEADLENLLARQQQRTAGEYHKWLTPKACQSTTLTATVTGGAPEGYVDTPPAITGTVNFFAGTTALGSCTISSATCSLTVAASALEVGPNSVTATFAGSPTYPSSTSSILTVTVSQSTTPPFGNLNSTLDSVTKSTTVYQADSVVIRGWAADQLDGAPLSNVTVYIDGNSVGTPTLGIARADVAAAEGSAYLNSGYQLSYSAATLAVGTHSVTVTAIDLGGRSKTFGPLTFTVQ